MTCTPEAPDFVGRFVIKWESHEASELIHLCEVQLQQTPNDPLALTAVGIVSVCVQQWAYGGAQFLAKAEEQMANAASCSEAQIQLLRGRIHELRMTFEALAEDANQGADSTPSSDIEESSALFDEFGDEPPFLELLALF